MAKLESEKRRQKRFQKRCTAEFASDKQTYRGICRNLCLDGLFIKTSKPLAAGKIVHMIVYLPDGSTSQLRGTVTRALKEPYSVILERAGVPSKDGMGIQLIEKDANYLNFVTSLIAKP